MSVDHPLARALAIALAGAAGAALVLVLQAPAAWIAGPVARATGGHLVLLEPEGTLWRGGAILAFADPLPGGSSGLALPGRLSWRLSPAPLLRGRLELTLEDDSLLGGAVQLGATASALDLSAGSLHLPASALTGLGAPWNTIRPGGELRASWDAVHASRDALTGSGALQWDGATSGLTPVSPFGQYRLEGRSAASGAVLQLRTLAGPLAMDGDGTISGDGRLRFHGRAQVQAGVDETVATQLSGLVSLLGRRDGDAAILDFGN